MRNKNKILLLGCALVVQGCGDSGDRSEDYLSSAKSYYEKEDYHKAKLELKNALQINNKLGEAYYYLALVDEKEQNWKGVYRGLAHAIKLDPENKDARMKMAKLYLLTGEVDKAEIEVNALLERVVDNPDVISLKGTVLLKKGETQAALVEAEKALALDPGHVDSVGLMVGVYLEEKDYNSAEKKINEAIAKKTDELTFYLLKLRVDKNREDALLVEKDYQNIIERFPSRLGFSYELAKFYVNTQRHTDALNLLKNVVESHSEELKPKLVLVDFLLQKDIENAETTLNKFIKESPSESALYFKLANLYALQKKYQEAKAPLKWILEHSDNQRDKINAKAVLARFSIQDGDKVAALKWVEEILGVDKRNYEALLLKARLHLVDGLYDDAITELRGILRDYSKSDEAMVLLGQAFQKKGSPVLAEEKFRKALELNPGNFLAVMPVVSRMIENQDVGRAERLLNSALKASPNHTEGLQVLAQLRLLKQDWVGSQEMVDLIAKQPKGQGFADYLSGKISQGQGQYKEAIEKYKLALIETPDLADALKSMTVCYEELKQRDKMHGYLDEFIKNNPTIPFALINKSQLYGLDENWDKAISTLNKGAEQWSGTYQFDELIAKIYLQKNEQGKAIEACLAGLKKAPHNLQLNLLLASIYENKADYDNAIHVYDEIIDKHPQTHVAVNNLVSILVDHASDKKSLERAVELAKRFATSNEPYFLDTYGWALLQNGDHKEARKVLDRVISMSPNVPVFNYHIAIAAYKSENNVEAIKFLNEALTLEKSQPGQFVEKEVAEVLLKRLSTKK